MLTRDEAIELMYQTVHDMNVNGAVQAGMPSNQIEEWMKEQEGQMKFVSGLLYDVLKDNGVIA
jgi:hypothetical protein